MVSYPPQASIKGIKQNHRQNKEFKTNIKLKAFPTPKRSMEKCMVTASIAFLLCHPNSSIKCSNPCKEKKPSPTISNPKQQQKPQNRRRKPQLKPHESNHLEATTTHLKVVYDHLESSKYPSIQPLEGILRCGWSPKRAHLRLVVDKVLKVKHESRVINKFEKYRDMVKEKATKNIIEGRVGEEKVGRHYYNKLEEDGFELLCFIGAKLACRASNSVCRKRDCGVCRLMRVIESSSLESLHSVSVSENTWMAHQKASKECGDGEGCRKAVVLCRVIGGRIADHRQWRGRGCSLKMEEEDEFDSVFVPVIGDSDSHDELLVFNPSAVLPCFVVLYSVEEL